MGAPLKARLDKTGWHLLCGWQDCGTRICRAIWMDKFQPSRGGPVVLSRVSFGRGWVKKDDPWMLTERSKKRIRVKLDRQERHALQRGPAPSKGQMKDKNGKWVFVWAREDDLPTRAYCPSPACERLNVIEPEERVSIFELMAGA